MIKRWYGEYPAPMVPIKGWMLGTELEWLYKRAKEHKTIIEIGCAYGKSSHAILTGNYEAFGNEGRVYCIDPWPKHIKDTKDQFDYGVKDTDRRSMFLQRCGHFPNLNIIELQEIYSLAMFKFMRGISMVFLDCGTANMALSIRDWEHVPMMLLCGHDHDNEYPDLKEYIESIDGVQFVPDSSLWYVERGK